MGSHQQLRVAEYALAQACCEDSLLSSYCDEVADPLKLLKEQLQVCAGSHFDRTPGTASGAAPGPASGIGAVVGDSGLIPWSSVQYALACSPFLASVIERYPAQFADTLGSCQHGIPDRSSLWRLRLAMQSPDASAEAFMRELREFRNLLLAAIALFDLTGVATVQSTLQSLSDLADVCISAALAFAEQTCIKRFGTPRDSDGKAQSMVVIGMGKLGGRELNFSSDIDLVFLYASEGQTDGPKVAESQEFFRRTGQLLIKYLDEVTSSGFVYRVDMRLRPFGASGPLVISLDAMENYLFTQGRDWERYAWIKSRVICGAPEDGAALEKLLQPFIYRRYLDYAVFDSLRDLKRQIGLKVDALGSAMNIKLGYGGIREIEFIAQSFQLVRGGREPALQERALRKVVTELAANGHLPSPDTDRLQTAYDFLRRTENRLQMVGDRQTHTLPSVEREQTRLAMAMCFDGYSAFAAELDKRRDDVHQLFAAVFSTDEEDANQDNIEDIWIQLSGADTSSGEEGADVESSLGDAGFREAASLCKVLQQYAASNRYQRYQNRSRDLIDSLIPKTLRLILTTEQSPTLTLQRVLGLFDAVAGRSGYLQLLRDSEDTHANLVQLFALSPWLAEFVTNHPVVLDELLDIEHAKIGGSANEILQTLLAELKHYRDSGETDLGELMDAVRQFQHSRMVRIAAADINGLLTVMEVSDRLSWLAEAVLNASLEIVYDELCNKHGKPGCTVDGHRIEPGIAVVAYGKLGGYELSYGSDLDLVFLHESRGDEQHTDGERPLDNTVFFARMAQKLVNFLTTLTAAGVLYEIDTRLRPNGRAGVLVTELQAFAEYQRREAWTWEHQALVRARVVAGSAAMGSRFKQIRVDTLCNMADAKDLRVEVLEMRQRMRRELSKDTNDTFDLKQGAGGIADIEFMVQYLVLNNAGCKQSLLEFTDNIRQIEGLQREGLLAADKAKQLTEAYLYLRGLYHRSAMSLEKPLAAISNSCNNDEDKIGDTELATILHRASVKACWQQIMREC